MHPESPWLKYWVDPKSWKFVGDFEGMYRAFEDPWCCQKRNDSTERQRILKLLEPAGYARILDVGCGLGGFTEMLRCHTGATLARGLDISPTAVEKAAKRYPDCEFRVVDVTADPIPMDGAELGYDLITLQEVVWYILPHLESVLRRIHEALSRDGHFLIEQSFPTIQHFGREYVDSPETLVAKYILPAGFEIGLQSAEVREGENVLLLKLGRKKPDARI